MAIKKIKISNFKSFNDIELELRDFNILIGANASGKSNFIQVFKFLRDMTNHGLENAISLQGGVEFLRNITIGSLKNFSVEVVSDKKINFDIPTESNINVEIYESIYEFALKFKKKGFGTEIAKDNLILKCNYFTTDQENKIRNLGNGEIEIIKINGKNDIKVKKPEKVQFEESDLLRKLFFRQLIIEEASPKIPILKSFSTFYFIPFEGIFSNFSIYDFDPKLPKKAIPIAGKSELEEDGSNLALILKNILVNKDRRRKLLNLVKDLLPFVDDIAVGKFTDKSLLINICEKYFKKQYLPSSLISDGTISIIALIIALYFEEKPLAIIEEPERNIHPHLISEIVNMMKEASQKKQIIVTTHNPEMIKHVDVNDILLVSRNQEGFSTISRPIEKNEFKTFLKNEIGIEDLYVDNLLEI